MIGPLAALLAAALSVGATPPGPMPPASEGLLPPAQCQNTGGGSAPVDPGPAATALRLDAAHELATGSGVLVAVIDTGVGPHPRLAGRLTGGGDYVRGGSGTEDCDGHGTAVAGLIAAAPDTADAFSGVAPGAQLLSIRQSSGLYRTARGPVGDVDTLAAAVDRAVAYGARVVNISEAGCVPAADAAAQSRALRGALRRAVDAGTVVVAAAGNTGGAGCDGPGKVSLPGWIGDDVLTVGAVDARGEPAPFTVGGPWVDVAAPGTGLVSLAAEGGFTGHPLAGTSFATPWVSGTAALLFERYPSMSAREVMARITGTAHRAAGSAETVGHGLVDPIAALTAAPLSPAGTTAARTAPLPGLGGTPAPEPALPAAAAVGVALTLGLAGFVALRRLRRPRSGRGRLSR